MSDATSNVKRYLLAALALALSISTAKAVTCEEFVARFVEGAAISKGPVPKFDLDGVNQFDADWRHFKITMFGDARATMTCRHGWVSTFLASANDDAEMSATHLLTLTGIGLYGNGSDWRGATSLQDRLWREADDAKPHVAKLNIDGAEVSLIISYGGVPSFQIDNVR